MEGTWYVLPTAFDEARRVDREAQRRLVETVLGWGVDGLVTMGVTSEATALTDAERDAVVQVVIESAAGRVPVVVGCSAASANVVVARAANAEDAGAQAALVSAPPGMSDVEALPRFYEGITAASRLPVVVQDEPAATGTVMPVGVLVRCVDAAASTAVKLEDPPTPPKIARLLEQRPGLDVFGGLGGSFALDELRHGARGTMTGFAFPEILAAVRGRLAEDPTSAGRIFDRYLPLIAFEAQARIGLAIRKEVLRRRGALRHATTRLGGDIDARTIQDLEDVLDRVGLRPSPDRLEIQPT